MVIGVLLGGIIIAKTAGKALGGDKQMSGRIVKIVMKLIMRRMNMIKGDIKILQIRKQRAMMAIRGMERIKSKLPMRLRKVISMEIANIKRNVSAVEALQNSLRKEMDFLKSGLAKLKKMMRR